MLKTSTKNISQFASVFIKQLFIGFTASVTCLSPNLASAQPNYQIQPLEDKVDSATSIIASSDNQITACISNDIEITFSTSDSNELLIGDYQQVQAEENKGKSSKGINEDLLFNFIQAESLSFWQEDLNLLTFSFEEKGAEEYQNFLCLL